MRCCTFILGLLLAAGALIAAHAADPSEEKPLVLAVHPYLPREEILEHFTPLANYLTRAIGRPVEIRVGRSYAEHIEAVGSDSVDLAYMGPVSYVQTVAKYGKKPLLARQVVNGNPFLKGEIIVRTDSPLRSLQDLRGKCFTFGDPDSTMSTILPRWALAQDGITPSQLGRFRNLESHDDVALAVLSGDCDAGAVKSEVFQKFAPKGLRALAELPRVHDHVFVTRSTLPQPLIQTLQAALLALNDIPEGRPIMAAIHPGMSALVPAEYNDYANLRRILMQEKLSLRR
ncbi:MAG: phosphate/phosphite/phosphonate ABC transporter substrate-binding protein [Betaproteobacteria bacterium]|nr:phosphate/phosphite/phosphonate ABC transporter substrate-binding protein [Betaproteobacteria bacterium]